MRGSIHNSVSLLLRFVPTDGVIGNEGCQFNSSFIFSFLVQTNWLSQQKLQDKIILSPILHQGYRVIYLNAGFFQVPRVGICKCQFRVRLSDAPEVVIFSNVIHEFLVLVHCIKIARLLDCNVTQSAL